MVGVAVSVPAAPENEVKEKKSRTKSPGLRVIGNRIYDSQNGKTCHQCRQKTMDFAAICTNQKGDKPCPIRFCRKCLLNRYGENAEEVALLADWKCPKCRDICNCSVCMKKKGHKPTGILVHTAKENGFTSVSELLRVKGAENFVHNKIAKPMDASPKKPALKDPVVAASGGKLGKENSFDGNMDLKLNSEDLKPISNKKSKKTKREGLKEVSNSNKEDNVNLKEGGQKKRRITEKVSETVANLDENVQSVKCKDSSTKKAKSKTHREEVSGEAVKTNGNSYVGVSDKKLLKMKSQEMSNKGVKIKRKKAAMDCDENLNGATCNDGADAGRTLELSKISKFNTEFQDEQIDSDHQFPQGTCLTTVAGIDLPPEDVGHALQFLEFCAGFGKVLDLKKGQAEAVIREIIHGRRGRRSQYSCVAQIYIQLLSLIEEEMGEESSASSPTDGQNSWFQSLGTFVSKCLFISKDIPSDYFGQGNEGYDKLSSSQKLKLLNFLCDEALNTKELRDWIDDQNSKILESKKDAREKVVAAKDKERSLKQKIKDELAKAVIARNGVPMSVSEYDAIVSQIKSEAAQAHAEVLEAMGMVSKAEEGRSDAVRTDPVLLDVNGRAFWRLSCYNNQSEILLQDLGTWSEVPATEKWFVYDTEQKQDIDRYISSSRTKRLRARRVAESCPIANAP